MICGMKSFDLITLTNTLYTSINRVDCLPDLTLTNGVTTGAFIGCGSEFWGKLDQKFNDWTRQTGNIQSDCTV